MSYLAGFLIAVILVMINPALVVAENESRFLFGALCAGELLFMILASVFWKNRLFKHVYAAVKKTTSDESAPNTAEKGMRELLEFSDRMTYRELTAGVILGGVIVAVMALYKAVPEAVQVPGMIFVLMSALCITVILNIILYDVYTGPLLIRFRQELPDSRWKEFRFIYKKYVYFFILFFSTLIAYETAARTLYSSGAGAPIFYTLGILGSVWSGIFFVMVIRSWRACRMFYGDMTRVARGDFSMERPALTAEYFILWVSLEEVILKFESIIRHIQNNSSELEAAAKVVGETSAEQNMALVRQSTSVTQTSSTLQELVQASHQIAESSSAVVSFAENTEKQADEGLSLMQESVQKVQLVRSGNEISLAEVISLSEAIIEIEGVLNFIISIADETNLIALNAGIEASSAGEPGKRFKVVANEVRNLSTRVTKSIRKIKSITRNIQDASTRMVETVEGNQEKIDQSVQWSLNTFQHLKDILDLARKSSDAAKQIYVAIQQQKIANQQISVSFNDIAKDIQHLAQASDRYDQYVQTLRKFSTNIEQAIENLQIQTDESNLASL